MSTARQASACKQMPGRSVTISSIFVPGEIRVRKFFVGVTSALACTISIASSSENASGWEELQYPYFSIRCSQGPFKRSFAGTQSLWNEFIYLKWDGIELTRLRYSTNIEEPHHWYDDEAGLTLKDSDHGGESSITVSAHTNSELSALRISVDLDATQESALMRFHTGFFTHGSWSIKKTGTGALTLSESTAIMNKKKLSSANSELWHECRLMDEFGADQSFGV